MPCSPGPSAFCPGCRLAVMVTPFEPSVKVASPTGLPSVSSSCAVAVPPPWASATPAPRVSSSRPISTSKPARLFLKILSSRLPNKLLRSLRLRVVTNILTVLPKYAHRSDERDATSGLDLRLRLQPTVRAQGRERARANKGSSRKPGFRYTGFSETNFCYWTFSETSPAPVLAKPPPASDRLLAAFPEERRGEDLNLRRQNY